MLSWFLVTCMLEVGQDIMKKRVVPHVSLCMLRFCVNCDIVLRVDQSSVAMQSTVSPLTLKHLLLSLPDNKRYLYQCLTASRMEFKANGCSQGWWFCVSMASPCVDKDLFTVQRYEKWRPFLTVGGNVNLYGRQGNLYGGFSKNRNLPTIWHIGFLNNFLKNSKATYHGVTYICVYKALFTIAQGLNQPRYSSTDEWIKKTQRYIIHFYELEIILDNTSQAQIPCVFSNMHHLV